MEVISKIILGIIQGITEILPISSSGHLILFGELLNVETDLAFLTFLHLTTSLAIILGFWQEIKSIFLSKKRLFLLKIFSLGILPTAIVAVLIHQNIENLFYRTSYVIFSLISVGILMILVDQVLKNKYKIVRIEDIKEKNALFIGLAQILALVPGVSRSGITIVAGIKAGLDYKTAISFSFLIGLPLIVFSFFLEAFNNRQNLDRILNQENLIAGFVAFVFAYFSICVFKKLAKTKLLTFFGIYRIILGLTMIVLLF